MIITKRYCKEHILMDADRFDKLWSDIIKAGFFSGGKGPIVLLKDRGRLIEFYNTFGKNFDDKMKTLLLSQIPVYYDMVYSPGFIFPEKVDPAIG